MINTKVRRLLNLSPHLAARDHAVYINVDLGRNSGRYLIQGLTELVKAKDIHCRFDVGVVTDENQEAELFKVFAERNPATSDKARATLQGSVQVARLQSLSDRPAHLVFRPAAPHSTPRPISSISTSNNLVRDTGFAGGLSEEIARFADILPEEVHYFQYVGEAAYREKDDNGGKEDFWDGPWRRRFRRLCTLSRRASLGLTQGVAQDAVPTRQLRHLATEHDCNEYSKAFITVHCDPGQGPEFFVGKRSERSGLYLVECSDRGQPDLPGRDIVSVTAQIAPFRAAVTTALRALPGDLRADVDDEVARGLLRDINLLRGTQVFAFMREAAKDAENATPLFEGLDNVLAMRFFLAEAQGHRTRDCLPIVVTLNDIVKRGSQLRHLGTGVRCDDIIVFYLPPATGPVLSIAYRLVEVKFGEPTSQKRKRARSQLRNTAEKLRQTLPRGRWSETQSAQALLLERDLAWVFHETLERYRAFGILNDSKELEDRVEAQESVLAPAQGEFSRTARRILDGAGC